jgi:uncharacterized membrane protein YidH (DUF202 family)
MRPPIWRKPLRAQLQRLKSKCGVGTDVEYGAAQKADVMTAENRSAQELAEDRTDMASARTLMAADRTLMAWIRTALSMLSFGFTIYKVLEGFQQAGRVLPNQHTPRNVGLFLSARWRW